MVLKKHTPAYIIWGAGNRGKSTLINHVVNYMLINGGSISKITFGDPTQYPEIQDYLCILTYKNKKYLIMSKGDNEGEFERQYEEIEVYLTQSIDAIIGAGRTVVLLMNGGMDGKKAVRLLLTGLKTIKILLHLSFNINIT